ncbi:MAG: 16S rRNA (guanine(966)-N(2))-methyltransferase RsmD [Planctomycetes bacterium]|nr:16S rRNA (guanine(966)-N(2))-methyltransferase RsmD [Planctomycetota bacterium]
MLRVTSGIFKGFKLEVPRLAAVRPPLGIVREALFNILGQDLGGWRVADIFAGSGIMGIEAMSRGAARVVFVEKHRAAAATITRNLEKTRMIERGRVVQASAFNPERYLEGEGPLDAVFVDPPFDMMRVPRDRESVIALVEALFASGEVADGAPVIVRTPDRVSIEDVPEGVRIADERRYGHSRIFFFVGQDDREEPSD